MAVMNAFQRIFRRITDLPAMNYAASLFYTLGGVAIGKDSRFSSCVFACIDAIVSRGVMAKPKLVHYDKNGDAKRDFDHQLLKVLRRPNPQQTWRDLMKWTIGHRETKGTAYWWLVPALNKKDVAQIRILTPENIDISEDENGNVVGYVYTTNKGTKIPFDADEVVAFPYFNPDSQIKGIGPLQAARLAQENDMLAQKWNNKLFKNGAMPSGVLQTDQKLSEETFERVKKSWKEQYAGESNMAKTAILEAGLKYERLSLSQADMAFYEGRKDAREEIMMIFRVPKAALGMSGDVNRANADATLYSFAINKIQPIMEDIFDRINEFVLPKFGLDPIKDVLEFDSLVPEDCEAILKEHTELLKNNVMTINEVRSRRGLADVAWGDSPFDPKKGGNEPIREVDLPEVKANKVHDNRAVESDEFNHEKHRNNMDALAEKLEKRFTTDMKKAHKEAQRVILEHLARTYGHGGLPNTNSIRNRLTNIFLTPITRMLTTSHYQSGKLAIKYLGITDGSMHLDNNVAVEWIMERALFSATSVVRTLREDMAPIIATAVTEGKSSYELSQNLKKHFAGLTDWKAKQIARTEVHSALSAANHMTAAATGRELYKKWADAGDDLVCEACASNSSVGFIPFNQAFPSGASHPDDSHPNCRCREYFEPASRHQK
jgi:HK97 family phage portal protein